MINYKKNRARVCLALALILTISFAVSGSAAPQDEYWETQSQQQELLDKIAENQATIDALLEDKESLQAQLISLQKVVSEYQAQVDAMDMKLAAAKEQLQATQMELDDKYHIYHMQIRKAEEFGTTSYWTILFQSCSMAEFLHRIDYVAEIMAYQENAINELQAIADQRAEEFFELNSIRADRNHAYTQLKIAQNQLQRTIEQRVAEIQALEDITEAQRAEITNLRDYARTLAEQMENRETDFSEDPEAIYEMAIVQTGEHLRNPLGAQIAEYTLQFLGDDYIWGGATPVPGFDCSGMMYYVFAQFGYDILRTARVQYKYNGVEVDPQNLQAADMVFFHPPGDPEISHVGMYLGGGWFIHAANRDDGVIVSSLYSDYYSQNYYGAKRIL